MHTHKGYVIAGIVGIFVFVGAVSLFLLDNTIIPDVVERNSADVSSTPSVAPATLAEQEDVYVEAVSVLASASSSVSTEQVETFLFETRVPYTFQSAHLEFAQSWAPLADSLDETARSSVIIEYYQSIVNQ